MTPVELIEAVYAARRRRDIDAVLAMCSDAVIYTINIDPDKPGSGTTLVGKLQNRAHLELIDEIWEPVATHVGPLHEFPRPASPHGTAGVPPATAVRTIIRFTLRHRPSGQILEGAKTHEWTVRDGKVVTLCETLDRAFVNAFMAMAEWSMQQSPADAAAGHAGKPDYHCNAKG